jgi:nitrogen fixation NifU-like protein
VYTETLLDHFRNPRNVGELAPPALTVEAVNPACGDILRLSGRFAGERLVEVRYKVRGCTAAIAAGSALTEWMQDKSRIELASLQAADIENMLDGLPDESKHVAALCTDAVRELLKVLTIGGRGL